MNKQAIVECLTYINNNQFVRQSQEYLNTCEKNKDFPLLLAQVFQSLPESQIKMLAFILFSNVLKRNWLSKRKSTCIVNLDNQKPIYKQLLIRYYQINFPYPKQLDDLVKHISKTDYPQDWVELHSYLLYLVSSIANDTKYNELVLRQLIIVKNVLKQQVKKRSYMNKKNFEEFTSHFVKYLLVIFQNSNAKILQAINTRNLLSSLDLQIIKNVDRLLLYVLQTINPELQDSNEIAVILAQFLAKIENIFKLYGLYQNPPQELQKLLKTDLKNLGNMQISYPFSFCNFLLSYEQMILALLKFNKIFKNKDLIKIIVLNLTKVLRTFNYYADEEAFKSSIICRNSEKDYYQVRNLCHQRFVQFFNHSNIQQIFNIVITDIFNQSEPIAEDGIEEEQSTEVNQQDSTLAHLGSALLYQVIFRFQAQSKNLIETLLKEIVQNNFQKLNIQTQLNIFKTVTILPKVFEKKDLPMELVMQVLKYLYNNKSLRKMFCLMLDRFAYQFDTQAELQQNFNALVQIATSPQSDIPTIYQSVLTIKKILAMNKQDLQFSRLSRVIVIIVQMFDKFSNPNYVWPLVNLANKLLDTIDFDQNIINALLGSKSLLSITKIKDEIIVYPVCQLLDHLLIKTKRPELIQIVFQFVRNNLNLDLENKQIVLSLLLTAAQIYDGGLNLQSEFVNIFQLSSEDIKEEYPKLFMEILEELILMKLMNPPTESLLDTIITVYTDNIGQIKVKCSCLSLYSTLMDIRPIYYNFNLLRLLFEELNQIKDRINTEVNSLRTNIIYIINKFIVNDPAGFLQQASQQLNTSKEKLQEIWLTNTEFLNCKSAFKLNSLALLLSLEHLNFNSLDLYFEILIKIILIQLDPLEEVRQQFSKKSRSSLRKQELRINQSYLRLDLNGLFKQKILQLRTKYNLSAQFFLDHIKSETILTRFSRLLDN